MEFRYVVNGKADLWQKADSVSVAKMQYKAECLNEKFGNNWYIEWRQSND